MTDRTISALDLNRLRQERNKADREYNDALTALNRSLRPLPELPPPPPAIDQSRLDTLHRLAEDTRARPASGGWRRWARRLVRPGSKPSPSRQEQVSRTLIEQLTQSVADQQATSTVIETGLNLLRSELEARRTFEFWVAAWAQRVTPYIDTKTREATGLIRRVNENPVRMLERTIGLLQQRQLAMKRELEQLLAAPPAAGAAREDGPSAPGGGDASPPAAARSSSVLDAYKYVGFEEAFRGTEADIRQRLEGYCGRFSGTSATVLDIGCGRGEFLDVLRERGMSARGLDANHEMVAVCRERGLEVEEGDAVGYLESIPDASLGGLIATQVVEHFRSDYLLRFLELAYHKLRPGSTIILETLNVDSWSAFFGPYLRDITHERPIPPETLRFLLEASGFQRTELQFSSPADEDAKLRQVELPGDAPAELATLVDTFNANVGKINTLLFTFLDYAAIGQKL